MIYKEFCGHKLAALGFGAMRLPQTGDGPNAPIDEAEAIRMLTYGHEQGVNYFDTAYSYHGGASELVLGKALAQFPRDSFYLASKFPGHELRPSFDVPAIFEDQLRKCGVDYFDFYLLHNVYEKSLATYLDPQWGIVDYLKEQKKAGRIRHLGFSAHGNVDVMQRLLDAYGDDMEFCQIQLNYLDWTLQEAEAKYKLLTERGLGVWVMEPVRGGKLAHLTPAWEARLKALRPQESVAAWSFRWLLGLPAVTMILSGMTTMEQVEDNLRTFEEDKPLSEAERALLAEAAVEMADLLPCTACRYCCRECPKELDIPFLLSQYNDARFESSLTVSMAIDALADDKRPEACESCGNCREVCPQGIDVPAALADLSQRLKTIPRWADISNARAKQSGRRD